jgi:hypothetical protein
VQIEVLEGGIDVGLELRNAVEGSIFLYTITAQAGAPGSRRAARSPGEGGPAPQDSAVDAWPVSEVAELRYSAFTAGLRQVREAANTKVRSVPHPSSILPYNVLNIACLWFGAQYKPYMHSKRR